MTLSVWELAALLMAPALLWGVYHYYRDVHKPEPWRWLLFAYVLGIGSGWLGLNAYVALDWFGWRQDAFGLAQTDLPGLLRYSLFVIGPIEELVKFIPFWLLIRRIDHFDEPVDAVIYAAFISLGFATYENYWYLPTMHGWEAVGRALASPLVHVVFSSIWAYPIGWAHAHRRSEAIAAIVGLIVAFAVHGAYDFVVIGLPTWMHIVPPILIGGLWLWHVKALCHLAWLHHERERRGAQPGL